MIFQYSLENGGNFKFLSLVAGIKIKNGKKKMENSPKFDQSGSAHRVENPSDDLLVFIEVQQGEYFVEDDIVRLEDDFGRTVN